MDKVGLIRELTFNNDGSIASNTILLDIKDSVFNSGERGLLGFAFHPDHTSNGYFYLNYSCRNDGCIDGASKGATVIARYNSKANDISNSFLPIAVIPQPFSNHNGGCMQFSGSDGYLYIGMGDGGSGNDPKGYSQDLTESLGKMLRVDIDDMDESSSASLPRWNIPLDNPFIGDAGALDEIWAYGLRNPWRFSFDRETNDMYIADVGQGAREEVNFQPSSSQGGENYGWRQCEGMLPNSNYLNEIPEGCECETMCNGAWVPPILEYGRNLGKSITGGYVYRGSDYINEFGGVYFYADYVSGNVWGVKQDGLTWSNVITTNIDGQSEIEQISTFGEDGNGELYMGGLNGALIRIRGLQEGSDAPTSVVTSPSPTASPRVYMDVIKIKSKVINPKKWRVSVRTLIRESQSDQEVKGVKINFLFQDKKKLCKSKNNGMCVAKMIFSVENQSNVNITVANVNWKLGGYDATLNDKNDEGCPIFSDNCPFVTLTL